MFYYTKKTEYPDFSIFVKKVEAKNKKSPMFCLRKKKRVPYRGVCGYIILNSANSAVWYYSSKLLKPVQCRLCARAIGAHVIFVQRYFFLFVEFYGGAGFARCSTFSRRHGSSCYCIFCGFLFRTGLLAFKFELGNHTSVCESRIIE